MTIQVISSNIIQSIYSKNSVLYVFSGRKFWLSNYFLQIFYRALTLKILFSTYFLIDALTVLASYLYTRQFFWLVVAQQIEHYYYVLTWNKSYWSKRVAFWSSLDWYKNGGKSRPLEFFGTSYDILTHILMMYSLAQVNFSEVQFRFKNVFLILKNKV